MPKKITTIMTVHQMVHTLRLLQRLMDQRVKNIDGFEKLDKRWYEVIHFLAEDIEEIKRMQDITDQLVISNSGTTRIIDQMEDAGIVTRYINQDNRRENIVELTDKGKELWSNLLDSYNNEVTQLLDRYLDEEEIQFLNKIMVRLAEKYNEELSAKS